MHNIWFWLAVLALLVGIAYILVAHPPIAGAVLVMCIGVALCGVSWVFGDS